MEHTTEASKASFFVMLLYTSAYVIMLGLVSTSQQDDVMMTAVKVYILLSIGITGRVCLSKADFPVIEDASAIVRIYFMVIGLIFYSSFVPTNRAFKYISVIIGFIIFSLSFLIYNCTLSGSLEIAILSEYFLLTLGSDNK